MGLVSAVFMPIPDWPLVLAFLGFGCMQSGVLLVNNAEDLDEDERERVRTVAVSLGALKTITLALSMVVLGAGVFAVALSLRHGAMVLAGAPLVGVALWNARWLARLRYAMTAEGEAQRRALIRAQGRYVPRRIESGAWCAMFAALVVFWGRS